MQVEVSIPRKAISRTTIEALHIQLLLVQIKQWKHQSKTKTPERRQ